MSSVVSFYVLLQIGILIVAVVGYIVWDKRYRKNHGAEVPKGFERTEEVMNDPSDGRILRVYYNSKTGERFYHEERDKR